MGKRETINVADFIRKCNRCALELLDSPFWKTRSDGWESWRSSAGKYGFVLHSVQHWGDEEKLFVTKSVINLRTRTVIVSKKVSYVKTEKTWKTMK